MSAVRQRGDAADLELDPSDFADRVMAAIETTPAPTPARSFVGAVRGWSLDDAMASLGVAWHLATVRTWSVAPRVRARSMALVLAVASVLATGSLVAAAAVRFAGPFGPDDRHAAPVTVPAGGIADPELDDHPTDGSDGPTSLDADHHVAEPVVEPVSSDHDTTKKAEGDTDPGSQGEDASDDAAHDGEQPGSGAHEGGDAGDASGSGDDAHDSGSHDGDTSDDGSHGTSGGDSGHDGSGSSGGGDGEHDSGDGGD